MTEFWNSMNEARRLEVEKGKVITKILVNKEEYEKVIKPIQGSPENVVPPIQSGMPNTEKMRVTYIVPSEEVESFLFVYAEEEDNNE